MPLTTHFNINTATLPLAVEKNQSVRGLRKLAKVALLLRQGAKSQTVWLPRQQASRHLRTCCHTRARVFASFAGYFEAQKLPYM